MGILNKQEIIRRVLNGELLKNYRISNGTPDVEFASYDLTAGTAVWKETQNNLTNGGTSTICYDENQSYASQKTKTLEPGQMMFVITREEVVLPNDLCATVYSRNKLSRNGILAFNAGHIDPGYMGPIVVRLINMRSTPWTLRLGEPIYTIVFHTLDFNPGDQLAGHHPISVDETLRRVTTSADESLSNAFYDLSPIKQYIGQEFGKPDDFLKRSELGKELWKLFVSFLKKNIILIGSLLAFFATIGMLDNIIDSIKYIWSLVK